MTKHLSSLLALSLLAFTAFMDFTIVSTALPAIQAHFGLSVARLQWVVTAYFLANSVFMIFMGRIGDRVGHKRCLIICVLIFFMATAVCALTDNAAILLIGRFLQGVGSAGIFPLCFGIVSKSYQEEAGKVRAIGIYGAITSTGLVVGPTLAGFLLALFTWRSIFWINLPLIAIGLIVMLAVTPADPPASKKERLDVWGFILLVIGLGALLNGVASLSLAPFYAPIVWLSFLVAVILLPCFLWHETKMAFPLLNLRYYSRRYFVMGNLSCLIGGALASIALFYDPLYLQHVLLKSPESTGLLLLLIPLGTVLFSLIVHRIVKAAGLGQTIVIGLLLGCVAFFLQANVTQTNWSTVLPISFVLIGILWANTNNLSAIASQKAVTHAEYGLASAATMMMFNVGGSLGVALTTIVFSWQEKRALQRTLAHALNLPESFRHQLSSLSANLQQIETYLHSAHTPAAIFKILQACYLSGFRSVMWVCVLIAIIGALIIFFLRATKNDTPAPPGT